ncbi:hypothetical protein Ocin01_06684 [Orchesella cincta]|uniref:Uncharacterized protein n=1 Tax=Orchesella cincta TaxID=48709 RepID=A0A1D2N442_ORCCI|nr:hypothetical protein Ocin01_06684 [Orchesella cincta]
MWRPSARNRKPVNNQRDKIPNPVIYCPSVVVSVMMINRHIPAIVHRMRAHSKTPQLLLVYREKVESLDGDLKRLDQAVGRLYRLTRQMVLKLQSQRNPSKRYLRHTTHLTQLNIKPDGVTEVRGDLAKLGSRVQELSSIVQEKLKDAAQNAIAKENETANAAKPTASST